MGSRPSIACAPGKPNVAGPTGFPLGKGRLAARQPHAVRARMARGARVREARRVPDSRRAVMPLVNDRYDVLAILGAGGEAQVVNTWLKANHREPTRTGLLIAE